MSLKETCNMRKILLLNIGVVSLLAALPNHVLAQGCIAVRGADSCFSDPMYDSMSDETNQNWTATIAYRYLHSFRHFVGDVEQKQREIAGNQVINHQNFVDLGLQYAITPRWSIGLTLPYEESDRSQLASANFAMVRYHTQSAGFGDGNVTGYAWLWDPAKQPKGNIQLGLGLKMPTGQDDVNGTFLTSAGAVSHPVDQSIQPGDGGWGCTVELNAYREILPRTQLFFQASYLFNQGGNNGVLTWRDNSSAIPGNVTATPSQAAYYEHFMSRPDQYFARGGISYTLIPAWGLSFNVGGRIEGVPVYNLITSTDGFRRPGYAVDFEPGLQIEKGRYTFNVSAPYAVYRNRQQSLADKEASAVSGTYVAGDAAFADYVITASLAVRF